MVLLLQLPLPAIAAFLLKKTIDCVNGKRGNKAKMTRFVHSFSPLIFCHLKKMPIRRQGCKKIKVREAGTDAGLLK